ncbi:hypothetical protein D3C77_507480 [compost metagenome]
MDNHIIVGLCDVTEKVEHGGLASPPLAVQTNTRGIPRRRSLYRAIHRLGERQTIQTILFMPGPGRVVACLSVGQLRPYDCRFVCSRAPETPHAQRHPFLSGEKPKRQHTQPAFDVS